MRIFILLAILLMAAPSTAWAQAASPTADPALYAVNSAALASAISLCTAKHGELRQGSPGQQCFNQARNVLANFELRRRSQEIASRCDDTATFNTCLTPEIARLVFALSTEFGKHGL